MINGRNRHITIIFLCLLCNLVAFADPSNTDPPNIVFILVDDMGYGDLGSYNPNSKIPTPNIDSLAQDGMRFTDAHASGPLCHVSRYGLLTGRYPFRTEVSDWRERPLIDEGQATIASVLRRQGYRTAMVGKWHLGFKEDGYDKPLPGGPVDVGFDSFFGIRASTDIPPYFYIHDDKVVAPPSAHIEANNSVVEGWKHNQGAFWREGGIAPELELKDVLPRFTDEAIAVINDHSQSAEPLMLYLAYPAPHTPWLPSDEFQGSSEAGMYGDFMVMVDAMVGRVLAALDEAGMTENTLVVFSSDNGPLWHQMDTDRFGHESRGGLRGMKGDTWEGGHRMPFIVRWPGKVKKGVITNQLISFTDMLATFAAISGAELGDNDGPDSLNVLPILIGEQAEDEPIRESLVVSSVSGVFSIRSGPWKYIEGLGSGGFSDRYADPETLTTEPGGPDGQLYNIADDPAEERNLFLQNPDIVQRLKSELEQIRAADGTR